MSLWTCPTHGLHGPMPGNVCPMCGAAMSWTTVLAPQSATGLDMGSGATSQPLWPPQQGANAAEQASGAPTLTGPSATRTPAYRAIIEAVAQAAAEASGERCLVCSGGKEWPNVVATANEYETVRCSDRFHNASSEESPTRGHWAWQCDTCGGHEMRTDGGSRCAFCGGDADYRGPWVALGAGKGRL